MLKLKGDGCDFWLLVGSLRICIYIVIDSQIAEKQSFLSFLAHNRAVWKRRSGWFGMLVWRSMGRRTSNGPGKKRRKVDWSSIRRSESEELKLRAVGAEKEIFNFNYILSKSNAARCWTDWMEIRLSEILWRKLWFDWFGLVQVVVDDIPSFDALSSWWLDCESNILKLKSGFPKEQPYNVDGFGWFLLL